MELLLRLCVVTVLVLAVDGQPDPEHERLCGGVLDFDPCSNSDPWICNLTVSGCFCKSETPFCRCNNFVDEFYLGENCNQKWTTLTFALVASLPGVTLALLVGVIVHILHSCQPNKSSGGGNKRQSSPPTEESMFPGLVFASDLSALPSGPPNGPPSGPPNGPPNGPPSGPPSGRPGGPPGGPPNGPSSGLRPPQGGVTKPSAFSNPYSPSAITRPTADRPPIGGPRLGGPQQPYSYTAGPGQVLSNPYAKSRNPYEERSPSPDQYRSYNPSAPSQGYDDRRMSPSPAPSYSSPDYSNRSVFPRAQLNRMY